ncbi:MAG: hypothetical protein CMI12_16810 [Oceanospirillum sp.]|nr:hypothetical protein [Oceanospirillum sp.]
MLADLFNTSGLMRHSQSTVAPAADKGESNAVQTDKNQGSDVPKVRDDSISISYESFQSQQHSLYVEGQSEDSHRFKMAMQILQQQSAAGELDYIKSDGYETRLRLGVAAIGGFQQLQKWQEKGLELSEQTLFKAGDAFSEGQRQLKRDGTYSRKGLVMNRYDLVSQNQQVPEWFNQEKKQMMKQMPENAAYAFKQGNLFYVGSVMRGD